MCGRRTLRQAEERRDQALQVFADEWDVDAAELTLTRLAREAPEPSRKTFRELQ